MKKVSVKEHLIQKENICICHQISKKDIINLLQNKQVKNMQQIVKKTNMSTGCGVCLNELEKIFHEFQHKKKHPLFTYFNE